MADIEGCKKDLDCISKIDSLWKKAVKKAKKHNPNYTVNEAFINRIRKNYKKLYDEYTQRRKKDDSVNATYFIDLENEDGVITIDDSDEEGKEKEYEVDVAEFIANYGNEEEEVEVVEIKDGDTNVSQGVIDLTKFAEKENEDVEWDGTYKTCDFARKEFEDDGDVTEAGYCAFTAPSSSYFQEKESRKAAPISTYISRRELRSRTGQTALPTVNCEEIAHKLYLELRLLQRKLYSLQYYLTLKKSTKSAYRSKLFDVLVKQFGWDADAKQTYLEVFKAAIEDRMKKLGKLEFPTADGKILDDEHKILNKALVIYLVSNLEGNELTDTQKDSLIAELEETLNQIAVGKIQQAEKAGKTVPQELKRKYLTEGVSKISAEELQILNDFSDKLIQLLEDSNDEPRKIKTVTLLEKNFEDLKKIEE